MKLYGFFLGSLLAVGMILSASLLMYMLELAGQLLSNIALQVNYYSSHLSS